MGLIKAALGAAGGALADQWKEYFYCDSLDSDVLAVKGRKRTGKRSSNRRGDDNVISDGSVIAVNEGQCMMIVENGMVTELCAVPGEFVYDNSSEPSIFCGELGDSVRRTFEEIGKRFSFGGEAAADQRVYYFNTKEIVGNKYGTPAPVPFRVVDRNIGLDMDISIRCHGEYSYRITDPLLFYTNVCGNFDDEFTRDMIEGQLRTELMTALQPAFAKISEMGIRYSALPGHTFELAEALNSVLSPKWGKLRGIEIVSVGVSSVKASEEDEEMIKELQRNAAFRDPSMAAAHMVGAQAEAMQSAAKNSAGAMTGFMGYSAAASAGGVNAGDLFKMASEQSRESNAANMSGEWICSCGAKNSGKFCSECGAPKGSGEWVCSCGARNTGKFCSECGAPRPNGEWVCTCGAKNTGKFCSECGAPRRG
ncbi:MAG TPA: SPFH domain-containing protein [Candidatus Ornithomonoglobus merdipullorum]|uniref:SPFH domain-containing protein n=1 Tax=Candidatus Ornithomonoglobus merdipullorum TaxID=2840895 RepID=A0A9D1MBW5_9FIRM|nr:SPFH domain-containing protein [Candidatus Ornithomonoglobus merdipullorum]